MSLKSPKDFWGPCEWKSMHCKAATYNPNIPGAAQAFKDYIYGLVQLLPCKVCREHLKTNLRKLPLERYLNSNHQLFLWTYLLHDLVNQQLGKVSPSYLEVKRVYFASLNLKCESCL